MKMKAKTTAPELAKLKVVELAEGDPESGVLEGYASVFDNVDNGGEVILKGAFLKTLKERLKRKMILLYDCHQFFVGTKAVIGLVEEAEEDDYGLKFRARFSSTTDAQDIRTKIREQILTALSFGYDVLKDYEEGGIRYIKEVRLYEVSVVPWGMNPKAMIGSVKGEDYGYEFTDIAKDVKADDPTPEPPAGPPEMSEAEKGSLITLASSVDEMVVAAKADSLRRKMEEMLRESQEFAASLRNR